MAQPWMKEIHPTSANIKRLGLLLMSDGGSNREVLLQTFCICVTIPPPCFLSSFPWSQAIHHWKGNSRHSLTLLLSFPHSPSLLLGFWLMEDRFLSPWQLVSLSCQCFLHSFLHHDPQHSSSIRPSDTVIDNDQASVHLHLLRNLLHYYPWAIPRLRL